jgi:hypothetical protein
VWPGREGGPPVHGTWLVIVSYLTVDYGYAYSGKEETPSRYVERG